MTEDVYYMYTWCGSHALHYVSTVIQLRLYGLCSWAH